MKYQPLVSHGATKRLIPGFFGYSCKLIRFPLFFG